ncbi:MAG: hypothetical protein ACRC2T_17190 [Thermoguttaceae bacterium]
MKTLRILFLIAFVFSVNPFTAFTTEPENVVNDGLYILSSWFMCDAVTYEQIMSRFSQEEVSFPIPKEIDAQKPVYGASYTDGDEIYNIIVMQKAEPDSFDMREFDTLEKRTELYKNPMISSYFDEGNLEIFEDKIQIVLVSTNLAKNNYKLLREFNLTEKIIEEIQKISSEGYIATRHYNPLGPFQKPLPPESENDGKFLKKVRKTLLEQKDSESLDYELSTTYFSWADSTLMLTWDRLFTEESGYAEKMEQTSVQKLPLSVQGFYDPEYDGNKGLVRVHGPEEMKKINFFANIGIRLISPDERPLYLSDEGHESTYLFNFACGINNDGRDKTKGWGHVVGDEFAWVYYPEQPEIEPQENVVTAAELDDMNRNVAEKVYGFLKNVHNCLDESDIKFNLEAAFTEEDEVIYFGCSLPKIEDKIDWSLLETAKDEWIESFRKTPSLYLSEEENEEKQNKLIQSMEDVGQLFTNVKSLGKDDNVEFFEVTTGWDELDSNSSPIYLIIGRSPEQVFIAATTKLSDFDTEEAKQEIRDTMFVRLKERIDESKNKVAEKDCSIVTLYDFNFGNMSFKCDHIFNNNRCTVTYTYDLDSLDDLISISNMLGIKQFLLPGSIVPEIKN